jgi:hypothetical protein
VGFLMFKINPKITEKRFDASKFMAFADGYDIIDSAFLSGIKSLPVAGSYIVRLEPGRPDLLSYNLYRDTQYWWLLMLYNDLKLPEDLSMGLEIQYFRVSDLETMYFLMGVPT